MSWPLASHFSAMVQNPKIAFRDPHLQGCTVATDERKQPRPWSGAFAVVYQGTLADGRRRAIRVFTTESPERRERYDRISEYLNARRLRCLVEFEYRDRSIRSAGDGKWYPLVLMDWVDGDTLFKWVRARSLAGDGRALAAAAEGWIGVVRELNDAGIAHGDLQHANIMVTTAGELKLVDYDCMCVPALVGRRNLEVGVEPYQHPDRTATTHLGPDLDNFSALVIHVGLRALAADPSLWARHVEEPAHDKLLFRIEDFRNPSASPLYRELVGSPDGEVRELAEQLFSLWSTPMDQVPSLKDLTNSYAKVEQLLRSQQWEAAVKLLNQRGQFRDAPARLKPLIHQAYEYVCRQEAWAHFEKLPRHQGEENDRRLAAAWNEALFAGFGPAERLRGRMEGIRQRVALLDRLRHLMQQASEQTTYAKEWSIVAAAKKLPSGYQHSLRPRLDLARARVAAVEALERAVRETDDDQEIVDAWNKIGRSQAEPLVNAEHRPRIALAERRLPLLTALRAIPDDVPLDQLDRRLLDAWQDELAEGCPEIEAWREAHDDAVDRKELLGRMEKALSAGDEMAIARLLEEPVLEDYPLPGHWAASVRMARDRVEKTETLLASLETGDRSLFLEKFDVRLIRQYAERFEPHEATLDKWTRQEVLPLESIGLKPALGRASVVLADRRKGTYQVRWTWPQQRFTEECILAVCEDVPEPDEDPRELAAHHRAAVDRESWEAAGGSRLLHVEPEWLSGYVVVWAVVDLGFRLHFSHPLELGRLDEAAKKTPAKRKGWGIFSSLRGSDPGSKSPETPPEESEPEPEHPEDGRR